MEKIRFKKITVADICPTILTGRHIVNEKGWKCIEPIVATIAPTGSRIFDAIAQALAKDSSITVFELANALGTNTTDLNAFFRLLTGLDTREFLKQYRLTRACEWLANTDLKLIGIARRSGFPSASYMTHLFVQELKCTPNEYRKQHRPKNFRDIYTWD